MTENHELERENQIRARVLRDLAEKYNDLLTFARECKEEADRLENKECE